MAKKLLIVGCGYVGEEIALRALSRGYSVTAVRRDPSQLSSSVPAIAADVVSGRGFENLPLGFDCLIYSVAAGAHDPLAYENAYHKGFQNILSWLRATKQKPERVVFLSSTGVYGQDAGEWVDERSATEPKSFTGQTVLLGERLLLESEFPPLVVRYGGIYGPGRTHLLRQVRDGSAKIFRNEEQYTNRIHRVDCAESVLHLLSVSQPAPIYLAVDNAPSSRTETLRWIAERMGQTISEENSANELSVSGKRCRNSLLLQTGYKFHFPTFREGYESLLKD